MSDIVIKCQLKDHSMMYIDVDRGIAMEISEYFSFLVPGYKFMPAYKNKVWDGKIRLFNSMNGELNAGLFVYLLKFATERGYTVDAERNKYGLPYEAQVIDQTKLSSFIESLQMPYEVRNYQRDAINVGLQRKRAVLVSPTGSGKSLIIYNLIRWFMAKKPLKVLIVVPTTSLVEQMTTDFIEYKCPDKYLHKIYSGKDKDTDARVIISTWQSIYKLPAKWFHQFGMIVGDECHNFKSKSLSSIMNKAVNAEYRFGATGTLDGTLTHKLVLEGLFGPVYQVTTTKKLQENDTLSALKISILVMKYSDETCQKVSEYSYPDEVDFIVRHQGRNKFIKNLTLAQQGNTLLLFQYVEKHGKVLYDMIEGAATDGRKVFFVSGQTDTIDREAIRKIVEKQNNAIIVASFGTFSTGINIRNLHNIIFSSPSKSQVKVLQSIGRGLRKSDNGETTKLFDIADDLHWKQRKNYTLLHSAERAKIYSKEQFNYNIREINLNDNE